MNNDTDQSKTLKGSGKTYFFDIYQTEDGKPYLKITKSRFKGKEKTGMRNSIIVLLEDAENFSNAVSDMVKKITEIS